MTATGPDRPDRDTSTARTDRPASNKSTARPGRPERDAGTAGPDRPAGDRSTALPDRDAGTARPDRSAGNEATARPDQPTGDKSTAGPDRAGGDEASAGDRRVVFVTGAASGIGRASAEAFVRRGYATVLADVNVDAGKAVEAELRSIGECTFVPCDVSDDHSVRGAVAGAVATYGRLDAAFNAAGIDGEHGRRVADATMDNWNRVIAVDLTGTFSCMRYELPEIVKAGGGAIVNCASVAGLRAAPKVSAYTAAKHGVVGLTKAAAREYAAAGVRVNVICPGTVDTPMFRESMAPFVDQLIAGNPSRRLAEADEIAAVAVWLCADAPGFLTGEAIAVDGGAGA